MRISQLYCYPIKSCGGIELPTATVSLRGILHDRAWAVVDLKTHKVLTQREVPKLCLVRTALEDGLLKFWTPDDGGLDVPIDIPDDHGLHGVTVEVWGEKVTALQEDLWASGWFSGLLRRPCALVRMKGARRHKNRDIAFADAYECLVISEASLDDLNARLATPLSMDRFRPNVVVDGCDPYAEDAWGMIRLGGLHAEGATPCVRCVITTTDQRTAERGKEPLATLATYRRAEKGVTFGRNFSFMNGGRISVGDAVEVLRAP